MSAPDPSPGSAQSALSEAVEQAAAAVSAWCNDVADLAEREADRLSAGRYGLNDLIIAQMSLARIWVSNSIRTAGVLSDNLALLSYSRPGATTAQRTVRVGVPVPANADVTFRVSDLVGRLLTHTIPRARITLHPPLAASEPAARDVEVEMVVRCAGAPADTYQGLLSSEDGSIRVPFQVAIDEFGSPVR